MVRGYEILAQGRSSSTFQAIGLAGHLAMVFVAILGTDFVDELLSHRERKICTFNGATNQALIVLFVMLQWNGYRSFHKAPMLILPRLSLRKVFI